MTVTRSKRSRKGDDYNNGVEELEEGGISAYERERLQNIQRNEELLRDLGIANLKSSVSRAALNNTKKSVPKVPKAKAPVAPTRRSSRVTAEKLSAEIRRLREEGLTEEAQRKEEELNEMIKKQTSGVYAVESAVSGEAEGRSEYRRLPATPLQLRSALVDKLDAEEDGARQGSGAEDALSSLVQEIKQEFIISEEDFSSSVASSSATASLKLDDGRIWHSLSLAEIDVVKLTAQRVTSVAFHPTTSKLLAAAGDKVGHVSLWDVNSGAIHRFQPHVSNTMALRFSEQHPHWLHSFSYDGTLRVLDLEQEVFLLSFEIPEELGELYLSDACWLSAAPTCALVSKSDGSVGMVDGRASSSSYQWSGTAQDSRLTSVQLHPLNDHLIVTASARTGIALHDMRTVNKRPWKAVQELNIHDKSINAAYISPDGEFLVSVSQDDTVKLTSHFSSSSPATYTLRHNNFTGRWLSTFRPTFDEKRPSTFVLGSMAQPRRVEIFQAKSKNGHPCLDNVCNLQADLLGSVCSRSCFHKHLDVVLCSNSSGRVHLFR
eukprot:gene443-477_t